MAITVEEKANARSASSGQGATASTLYIIQGTDDHDAALAELLSAAPSTFAGLAKRGIKVEQIAEQAWEGEAQYGAVNAELEAIPTGTVAYSFETGGGSRHVKQSLQTTMSLGIGAPAPNFKGAIGVTEDGVEGVDVVAANFQFSETHYIASATVDLAFKLAMANLTGQINNGTFRGFAAGEVLFLGASGAQRAGGDDWEITFRFARSPNATGLTIGDINGVDKKGWEYVWVRHGPKVDGTANALVMEPVAAYVERVYESGSYNIIPSDA